MACRGEERLPAGATIPELSEFDGTGEPADTQLNHIPKCEEHASRLCVEEACEDETILWHADSSRRSQAKVEVHQRVFAFQDFLSTLNHQPSTSAKADYPQLLTWPAERQLNGSTRNLSQTRRDIWSGEPRPLALLRQSGSDFRCPRRCALSCKSRHRFHKDEILSTQCACNHPLSVIIILAAACGRLCRLATMASREI